MRRLFLLLMLLSIGTLASATVPNVPFSVSYTCTGSTGPFAFTFPISDPTAMTVTMNGTLLASNLYTIVPVNNNYMNGGSVTLNVANPCQSGWPLILARATPITQTTQFYDNMPTPYKQFEKGLDKLTEISQEIEGSAVNNLPDPVGHGGQYLGSNNTAYVLSTPPGGGNVTGPGSSTANHIAAYTDNTGTLLNDSGILYTNVPTMASNASGANNIITSAGANKTQQDSGIPISSVALPIMTGKSSYTLSNNGSAASWVAPMTYPASIFGIVADNSTDNTAAINTAATTLTAIGPGNRILLPIGVTKATSGPLVLKGIILVGSGAPGWNGGSVTAPTSVLKVTHADATGHIQCLAASGHCGLENLQVVDDTSTSPFMEYTCGVPWLDNVMFVGKTSRTSGGGTGVPVNDGINYGDAAGDTSSTCNTTAAGFSGYGSNHIQNVYFQNIRTFINCYDNCNGITHWGLRGDFTDANTSGYMIYINGSTNPAYGNKFYGNFEQAAFGGGAGSCNYLGVMGLDNHAQANFALINDSDVGDCTKSVWQLSTNAVDNYIVQLNGFFSGGAFSSVSGSYPNLFVDMPNNVISNRYYYGVALGNSSNPFNTANIAVGIQSGIGAANTDMAGAKAAVANTMTYTFTGSYSNSPRCMLQNDTGGTLSGKTITNTSITVTTGGATDTVSWICITKG